MIERKTTATTKATATAFGAGFVVPTHSAKVSGMNGAPFYAAVAGEKQVPRLRSASLGMTAFVIRANDQG
jgi:hypothetical protein